MDKFEDALFDNDYTVLIATGVPTQDELAAAWDKVYVEYCQLSQDGTYNELFETLKEIDDLEAKITIANNSVSHLSYSYDEDLVKILNSFALRCNVKTEDTGEVLINKLNGVLGRIKRWFPLLNQRRKDLDRLRETNTDKLDRNYFDDWLDVMSEVKGYQIESGKITVSRFCRSLARIRAKAQQEQFKTSKNAH